MHHKNYHSIEEIILNVLELMYSPDRPNNLKELKDKLPFMRGDSNQYVEIGTNIYIFENIEPVAAEAIGILISLGQLCFIPKVVCPLIRIRL
jgi:hypothetical protein